jgi:hypothetical protein
MAANPTTLRRVQLSCRNQAIALIDRAFVCVSVSCGIVVGQLHLQRRIQGQNRQATQRPHRDSGDWRPGVLGEALQILAALHSLRADNIVYPPRMSAETFRLQARLLQEEARAASRPRNRTRKITLPPPSASSHRARSGFRLQLWSRRSIPAQRTSVAGEQIGGGGNSSTPLQSARSGADCEA